MPVRNNTGSCLTLSLRRRNILGQTALHQITPVHVRSLNHQFPSLLLTIFHRSKWHVKVSSLAAVFSQITLFGLYRKLMGWINQKVPESDVNLARKGAELLSVFVILKLMVEVTNKFDSMSIISSGSGSVPSTERRYRHLAPSFLRMTKSKEALPGFMGLYRNSNSRASLAWLRLFLGHSMMRNLSMRDW